MAAEIRQVFNFGFQGSTTIPCTKSVIGDAEDNRSVALEAGVVAQLIPLTLIKNNLKSVWVKVSKDCRLETNGTGGGAVDTFEIGAGQWFEWIDGNGLDCPFSANVTGLYATDLNPTSDADVEIEVRTVSDN